MLKIYDTLAKEKRDFKPINAGKAGIYTCGPTVYDRIHIGNIRAYLLSDILRRYLEYCGFEVRQIKNITDVGHLTADDIAQGDSGEDKIEKKALAEKKTPQEIANFYEDYFHGVEKEMNILPAHFFPKATAHIAQIIKIISALVKKGTAYEKNGNVFFDVTKFANYGKLSGNTLENLKVGARLEEHPDKKNPWDFALWLKTPKGHLMHWDSPWGIGYPGWHIECSAMSTEYLGDSLDFHTGGEDNIFPHHEAEIAQSESYTGQKFVNYWVHVRHLLVGSEKMSKSKGNFYVLEDIKAKGYSPMEFRLAILSSHYRNQMNFTWEVMDQAKANLRKISEFVGKLKNVAAEPLQKDFGHRMSKTSAYLEKFEKAMNDDLNTPLALATLYEMISEINKLTAENKTGAKQAREILSVWVKINKVFGIIIEDAAEIPESVRKIAEDRKLARINKDFKKSDELRDKIAAMGYTIEDLKDNEYLVKPHTNRVLRF